MPQWRHTVPLTVNGLLQILTPVIKVWMNCTTMKTTATNYAPTKCTYQKLNSLGIGENFISLKMYRVERVLMNGSVGSPTRYFLPQPLDLHFPVYVPSYIIVYFPNIFNPDKEKCLPDKPWTWVPTPVEK